MEWLTTLFRAFAKPFQWWVVVGPWERGLRIRLGKVAAVLAPGIHFRIPFLDRIHVQSVRLRTLYLSGLTVTTRDGHALTVAMAIDFSIGDLLLMFNSLSAPDRTLQYRAAAALASFVSQNVKPDVTLEAADAAVNFALAGFGCGIAQIRARCFTFTYARPYRLLMNDYAEGSGLHRGFDQEGMVFNT